MFVFLPYLRLLETVLRFCSKVLQYPFKAEDASHILCPMMNHCFVNEGTHQDIFEATSKFLNHGDYT